MNFFSRSVISGFISGAAITIAFSQIKHLLGLQIPSTESFFLLVRLIVSQLAQVNPVTFLLGISRVGILLGVNRPLVKQLISILSSGATDEFARSLTNERLGNPKSQIQNRESISGVGARAIV